MSDTLITVVAVVLSAILMFVFPVMTMADRADTVTQTDIQTLTSEFVNEIRVTGKLTPENYSKFIEQITSTGNTYDVELEFKILDENPGKKSMQSSGDKIGENVYYSVYTSQILEEIDQNKTYTLKEGDMVSVTIRNTNSTLSQQLKGFIYALAGSDTYKIAASQSGLVIKTSN